MMGIASKISLVYYGRHCSERIKQKAARVYPIRRLWKPVCTQPRILYYQLGPFRAKSTT